MYPLYRILFNKRQTAVFMDFKSKFHRMKPCDYENLYNDQGFFINRETDLEKKTIEKILSVMPGDKSVSVLDVGCGNGFMLSVLRDNGYTDLSGCDIREDISIGGVKYTQASAVNLPFSDNMFDVVMCNHTLEHIPDIYQAVNEIKRVAARMVIVTVPKQLYFHHSFDFHIHFFPEKSYLEFLLGMEHYSCIQTGGDWLYTGFHESRA